MKKWYVVHCKPQQDVRAEQHLRNQGFEVFRPLVKLQRLYADTLRQIVESMFPRYLFIHLAHSGENWSSIRSTRGVADLVRWGTHVPSVPNTVINEIQRRLDKDNCIDLDTKKFRTGERLRITAGPFTGYEGIFDGTSSEKRVIILLEIMQHTQRLKLPEQAVERV